MHFAHASYVTFEPPDIAYWHLIGNIDETDIVRIYKDQLAFCQGKSHIFLLIDVTRFDSITAPARRAAASGPEPGKKVMPVRGSVVIGASFHIQVLGLLVAKASRTLNRADDMELHFCDNEAQARSWIEKKRREIGA